MRTFIIHNNKEQMTVTAHDLAVGQDGSLTFYDKNDLAIFSISSAHWSLVKESMTKVIFGS